MTILIYRKEPSDRQGRVSGTPQGERGSSADPLCQADAGWFTRLRKRTGQPQGEREGRTETATKGNCLRGGVRFETDEVRSLTFCHCANCQKRSGAASPAVFTWRRAIFASCPAGT